ncbi:VOC family protein [Rathayibacter tanaceti]|uniref:Catechol 2,3-dioxygenase-like lactoylglutathione lyase family enzyme n=2 Tax=Rathayibacter tanaceti TaxID=1671680 RepID=A0ACD2XGM0_9MICO|nr:VOC family protein [Rathayibacter tanaceti]QHC56795.1 VOC family protein [Rathayibacter tanaceti]TCO33772.1 catechol 2,3-dioxygenase-like lactoylglutathione lyase family enzyme [Rathayibacter tanaceti]
MPIPAVDYNHIRLTVRDIAVSRPFYDSVFGFDVAFEAPAADAPQEEKEKLAFVFGGVIYEFPGGLLGLRPVAEGGDHFDEDRIGLDHVSFAVPDLDALKAAAAVLDDLGIEHEPIKDTGGASILEFRDPDNIALEITSPS